MYSRNSLGVNGEDGARICCELAPENPQVADKRADSLKRLKVLRLGVQACYEYGFI